MTKQWEFNSSSWCGGYQAEGVRASAGKLIWFTVGHPGYAETGSSEQTYDDFLEKGPRNVDVPEKIVKEIWAHIIKERDGRTQG